MKSGSSVCFWQGKQQQDAGKKYGNDNCFRLIREYKRFSKTERKQQTGKKNESWNRINQIAVNNDRINICFHRRFADDAVFFADSKLRQS